ncbi:MAG TPA: flagellar biosynthetic protein FliO [Terracidiphilus sp.]|nr:flagellar biosynthetic protein FliO [Terracidiphilus sp.]
MGRVLRQRGGLAAWLMERLKSAPQVPEQRKPRLALLDRISLAPRQSLALVEAEGRRLLVATSPDGGPVFYALDGSSAGAVQAANSRPNRNAVASRTKLRARTSW